VTADESLEQKIEAMVERMRHSLSRGRTVVEKLGTTNAGGDGRLESLKARLDALETSIGAIRAGRGHPPAGGKKDD